MQVLFTHNNVKQHGPQYIKDNVTHFGIVKNPVKSDSYAVTNDPAQKLVAKVAATGSDVIFNFVSENLIVTFNPKSGVDQVSDADEENDDICWVALNDTDSEVLYCTDAIDRDITNNEGDRIDLPSTTYSINELVPQ